MKRLKAVHFSLRDAVIIGWVYRGFVLTLGFVTLILGVLMLALPGPGILTTILGLSILSTEFVWAQNMLVKMKAKGEKLLEDAKTKVSRKAPGVPLRFLENSKQYE